MRLSISEILFETSRMERDEDQVAWLKKHDDPALRLVLKFWYNPEIEFIISDQPPQYRPLRHNNHGILYGKARLLPLFVKGGSGPNLSQFTRESRFIEILQAVHGDDAEMLLQMVTKKPLDYLDIEVVKQAFPEIF